MQTLIRKIFGGAVAYRTATGLFFVCIALAIGAIVHNWEPGNGLPVIVTCAALGMLIAVPKRPLWGIYVYVAIVYGFPRYSIGVDFVYANFIPEFIAYLTGFGTLLWLARDTPPTRINPTLAWLMVLFVFWSLLSAALALASSDNWLDIRATFDLKHHPGRLLNAALLMFTAALALSSRRDFQHFAVFVSLLLITKWCLYAPDIQARPADFAGLAVMLIPLCLSVVMFAQTPLRKIAGAIVPLALTGLVLVTENRGAAVALVFVALVLWLQSSNKRRILLFALPVLVAAAFMLQQAGIGQRFEALFDDTPLAADRGPNERLALWRAAPLVVAEHWLSGVGPGRSPKYIAQYTPDDVNSDYAVHNNFLAVITELGVPGLLLYIGLFGGAIVTLWQRGSVSAELWPAFEARLLAASLSGYLVVGLFITRHDQALPYVLVGMAIAVTGYNPHRGTGRKTDPESSVAS